MMGAMQAFDQGQPGIGEDPRYGPTAGQLKTMRDEIAKALDRIKGSSRIEERRRLKAAHELFLKGVRSRLDVLRKEVRYLQWMMAGFAPAEFRGAPAMQMVVAVLNESDGRVWLIDLFHAITIKLGMKRDMFWGALRRLDAAHVVKVHEHKVTPGKPPSTASWVEVLTMTGGGAKPPDPKPPRPTELSLRSIPTQLRRSKQRLKVRREAP